MSRKSWSNLFIVLGVLNVAGSLLPFHAMKIVSWIAIPCCLALATVARRRMIPKNAFTAGSAIGKELGDN